ncbi:MAG: hypothetical protein M5U09_03710 [Gammaproteobacteria bacterium]|nr:hypothetical protein [Gammaproteobacteria bacterium]
MNRRPPRDRHRRRRGHHGTGERAGRARVLIIQALDQPTDLKVNDAPIQQAISDLAANTGIPIRLATGTLSLLPYGSKTTLSATIQNRRFASR